MKVWRKKHSLTQREAAHALGVSLGAVRKWESGENPLPKIVEKAMALLSESWQNFKGREKNGSQ